MKIEKLISNKGFIFEDIKIVQPNLYRDERGYFYESWNELNFNSQIKKTNFCQENHSYSSKNVLRGLHFQKKPHDQAKFVECVSGRIYDVVVDLRKNSDTFLDWGGVELSSDNHKQLWIPEGFAHGFYTLSSNAHLIYKVNKFWHKDSERIIIWNDPKISINWLHMKGDPLISKKDALGKKVDDFFINDLF